MGYLQKNHYSLFNLGSKTPAQNPTLIASLPAAVPQKLPSTDVIQQESPAPLPSIPSAPTFSPSDTSKLGRPLLQANDSALTSIPTKISAVGPAVTLSPRSSSNLTSSPSQNSSPTVSANLYQSGEIFKPASKLKEPELGRSPECSVTTPPSLLAHRPSGSFLKPGRSPKSKTICKNAYICTVFVKPLPR